MTSQKNLTTIGPKVFVDFPELGLSRVPAKVDTGADSSAIWATNIQEADGKLSFCLFGDKSPFYTGERITTDKYAVANVKNSFGVAERRYRTRLSVRIAGRLVRVSFTLANRESQQKPILIGRRTLKGKFIVDVSAHPQMAPAHVLLMSAKITPNVRNFVKGVEAASEGKIIMTHDSYDDLCFMFDESGAHINLFSTGRDVATFDMVHIKTVISRDVAAALGAYLLARKVPVPDEATAQFSDISKLYQYVLLADAGVQIPKSVFVVPSRLPKSYELFREKLGMPFVLKDIYASRGEANYLIHDEAEFAAACDELVASGAFPIAQVFIPNDGDYRILVLGNKIALAIYRKRQNDATHLNNTSRGGTATLTESSELPSPVIVNSLISAKTMGRGVAGVDMIQDKITKLWYCLEVNVGPQLATGAFVAEKQAAFAQFIQSELRK